MAEAIFFNYLDITAILNEKNTAAMESQRLIRTHPLLA
ncbi:hypothetical protein MALU111345_02915 [Marinicrinis lubricantis]